MTAAAAAEFLGQLFHADVLITEPAERIEILGAEIDGLGTFSQEWCRPRLECHQRRRGKNPGLAREAGASRREGRLEAGLT